jgi:hypothetical protein
MLQKAASRLPVQIFTSGRIGQGPGVTFAHDFANRTDLGTISSAAPWVPTTSDLCPQKKPAAVKLPI